MIILAKIYATIFIALVFGFLIRVVYTTSHNKDLTNVDTWLITIFTIWAGIGLFALTWAVS